MSALEIALLIFAVILIVVSFFLVDKEKAQGENTVPVPDMKQLNVISERAIRDMNTNANKLLESTQDQMETISNDKIMAVNEYSDQVLAKIDSNHKEAVFLYQMLQDKEKELKETVSRLESFRIECEKQGLNMGSASLSSSASASSDAPRKLDIGMEDFSFDDEPADDEPDDRDFKKMKSKDRAKQRITYVSNDVKQESKKNAPEKNEKTNEVIKLYKKNKSVMEISKLLNMGQGEVKLIIDLYCKKT